MKRVLFPLLFLIFIFISPAGWAADPADPFRQIGDRVSANFDDQLRALERDAGTTSSQRVLRNMHFYSPARLEPAMDWFEAQRYSLNEESTTATLIREVIKKNPELSKPPLEKVLALPALFPEGFDTNTPVASYTELRIFALLTLARASLAASTDPQRAIQDAMTLMTLGRHMQCRNVPNTDAVAGLYIQRATADFLLSWIAKKNGPVPGAAALARNLARERALCRPMREITVSEINVLHRFAAAGCREIEKEIQKNPRLLAQARRRLAALQLPDAEKLTDAQIAVFFSAGALEEQFKKHMALLEQYSRLSPAERLRRRAEFDDRFANEPELTISLLSGAQRKFLFYVPLEFDFENWTDADLHFLITALAIQAASLDGRLLPPREAVKRLALPEELGLDPYTGKPFECEFWPDANRAALKGISMDERKSFGIHAHAFIEGRRAGNAGPFTFWVATAKQ